MSLFGQPYIEYKTEVQPSDKIKILYDVLLGYVLLYYRPQVPEVFDKPFTFTAVDNLTIQNVDGMMHWAFGSSTAYAINAVLDMNPSFFTATTQASTISHEVAHTLITRKTGIQGSVNYLPVTKDGINLVHYVFNEYEAFGKSDYIFQKKLVMPWLFMKTFYFPFPYITLNIVDINHLLQDKDKIQSDITNGKAIRGKNLYE